MIESILTEINRVMRDEIKPRMAKCDKLRAEVSDPDKKQQLDTRYKVLDVIHNRCSVCLEILMGNAYTFKDEVSGITVVLPKDAKAAKYVVEAEKLGAEVVGNG